MMNNLSQPWKADLIDWWSSQLADATLTPHSFAGWSFCAPESDEVVQTISLGGRRLWSRRALRVAKPSFPEAPTMASMT